MQHRLSQYGVVRKPPSDTLSRHSASQILQAVHIKPCSQRRITKPRSRDWFQRSALTRVLNQMEGKNISEDSKSQGEEPPGMLKESFILSQLACLPNISTVHFGPNADTISVQFGQRDLPGNTIRKYLRSFTTPDLGGVGDIEVQLSFPVELRDVLLHSISPTGRRQLIVRAGKDADSVLLEVWSSSNLIKEIGVPKTLHGAVYNDNWFGTGVSWSSDETCIAYVAEAGGHVKTPEWGAEKASGEEGQAGQKSGPRRWRGVGEYQEDWGELNTGKKAPNLFILDIPSGVVTALAGGPEACSLGQPIWTPDDSGLVFVAWPHKSSNFPQLSQRLGIVYCVNRPSFLYHATLPSCSSTQDAKAVRVGDTGLQSALFPRFSPSGKSLVFLSHEAAVTSGVHCASATLEKLPWPSTTGKSERLVDLVQQPTTEDDFPGLHTFLLSQLPFAFVNENRILITSHWRSFLRILDVEWKDGQSASVQAATKIEPPAPSWTLLAVKNEVAVAALSGPGQTSRLALAHCSKRPLEWHLITAAGEPGDAPKELEAFFDPQRDAYKVLQVWRSDSAKLQLSDAPLSATMAESQAPCRGSLGFGENFIQSLPGNVGNFDVADCTAALEAAVQQGFVDPEKVAVVGGSHGGLLAGHLLGQHPDKFKAGVLRNPVMDIALMAQISDIPDWCFIEALGSKDGLQHAAVKPSMEVQQQMVKASPIAHVGRVQAPMFFMLGAKDRRVCMKDAQQYLAALRASPCPPETRVIVFPEDTHALDRPQTEYEQLVNIAWWLKRFL